MGTERRDGVGPNHFTFAIERIMDESRLNPDISPYVFLARHFGREGRSKLKEVDKILVKKGLAHEPSFPGSPSYVELDPHEREEYVAGFGDVGLDAVIETLFEAKKTLEFDYDYLSSVFNELIKGTSVLPIENKIKPAPIDRNELLRLFGRNPSGEFIFSQQGLSLVRGLAPFLRENYILEVVRSRTLPPWERFAAALQMEIQSDKTLSVAQLGKSMPDIPLPKNKDLGFDTKRWNDLFNNPQGPDR